MKIYIRFCQVSVVSFLNLPILVEAIFFLQSGNYFLVYFLFVIIKNTYWQI